MKNKICSNCSQAVSDIPDGASVIMHTVVGPAGTPQNLILALRNHGAKNLTIITSNFGQTAGTHSLTGFRPYIAPRILLENGQIKKAILSFLAGFAEFSARGVEIELVPLGVLCERIRAGGVGLGAIYSPVGVGTIIAEGKERRILNGKEYILQLPIRADYAFIRAYKADKFGNLVYRGTARGKNPIMAMAADISIAEVDEIVEPGELEPESIVTPGCFIDRIVKIGASE